MKNPYIESTLTQEDDVFEVPLRPQALADFLGQEKVLERLEVVIGAAKQRNEVLGHCLFSGPPGLGKTTLASILSKSMGKNLVVISAPAIEKPGDLAGVLTNMGEGDFLFIDEIHRLNRATEEYLYPAMEDFKLDLMIDQGPNARSIQVKLNKFCLVGATTRSGMLSSPLRSRFGLNCRLDYYSPEVLQKIILRTARILNLQIEKKAALEIAKRSRGTPRIANNLLRWVRDYASMRHDGMISESIVDLALQMLSIDEKGLDEMDKKILEVIIDHYQGGPVGINTISVAIGEESDTIEEVYEPYLILQGFIKRGARGREVTRLAYTHLGKRVPRKFQEIQEELMLEGEG